MVRLGQLAEGEREMADAWPLACDDANGATLIDCRNVQALLMRRQKHPDQALALVQRNLASTPPHGDSSAGTLASYQRCVSHTLAAMSCSDLGRLDDALRHYLLAHDEAQRRAMPHCSPTPAPT